MARKEVPFVTELCPHCRNEITFKATMRWHQCPVCGMYITPCAMCDCDKINCTCECPLDLVDKPQEKIGNHLVDELVCHDDYICLFFDWEDDEQNVDGESFKILVTYHPENDSFGFFEERYDLNLRLIDHIETQQHLAKHEISVIKRRMRKVAKKIN